MMIMTTTYEALNTSRCVHVQLFTLQSVQERRGAGYSWDPEQETSTVWSRVLESETEPETVDLSFLLSLKTSEQHNQKLPIDVCQPLPKVVLVFLWLGETLSVHIEGSEDRGRQCDGYSDACSASLNEALCLPGHIQYLNTLGNGFVILSFKKLKPELCLWWAFWIQSPRHSSWHLEDMEPVLAAVNSESEYSCLVRTPIRKKRMWVKSTLCCCWGRMMSPLLYSALVKPTVSPVFTSQCHSFRCL